MSHKCQVISRSAVRSFTNAEQLNDALRLLPKPRDGRIVGTACDRLTCELKRNGEVSKIAFDLSDHDFDLYACHQAACHALEKLALEHVPSRFHHGAERYTQDGLPKGVSLGIIHETDSSGVDHPIWRVQVYWHNGHRSTNKSFRIGRANLVNQSMIDDTCRVASDFRRAYDQARLDREQFDSSPWDNWRELLTEETQKAFKRCTAILKTERIDAITKVTLR